MVARTFALTVAGLLGELLHAKRMQKLPSLRMEMQRLRQEAGFFISADLERFILSEAGE